MLNTSDCGLSCAYFDEQRQGWFVWGVQTMTHEAGEALVCPTAHLSLFSRIVGGFCSSFRVLYGNSFDCRWYFKHWANKVVHGITWSVAVGFHHHGSHVFVAAEQMMSIAVATETQTEDPKPQSCGCTCCSDARLLLQHVGTKALASMGNLCYFYQGDEQSSRMPLLRRSQI